MVNISQYTVVLLDDPRHPDAFQLTDDTRGKSYPVTLLVFVCFQLKGNICSCDLSMTRIVGLSLGYDNTFFYQASLIYFGVHH